MGVDAQSIGRRIAEARQAHGMTQQALASQVGLDRSALAKVEQGDRRVSALELARIAETLGDRIEWFLTDPAAAVLSHRNTAEPGAKSPIIDQELERRVRAVQFVSEHDSQFTLAEIATKAFPTSPAAVEELAKHGRSALNAPPNGPMTKLVECLYSIGTVAFAVELGSNTADAASILLERGSVALVNGSLGVGRRRLALAHELGHILVADEYTIDWRVQTSSPPARREAVLDRFARALLLPESSTIADWAKWGGSRPESRRSAAIRMASHYQVDMATLAKRLSELQLVDQSAASTIREFRTTKTDIVELDLVVRDELSGNRSDLPHEYAAAIIRLYKGEVISRERALDLFFDTWTEEDLPALPRSPEAAIWQFVS